MIPGVRPLDLSAAVREPVPSDLTLPAAIGAAVARDPSRVAVRDPRGSLTYGDLHAHASGLATQLLRQASSGPVVVLASPGTGELVAMVGAALAGRPFVLIDSTLPDASARAIAMRFPGAPVVTDSAGLSRAAGLGLAGAVILADDVPGSAPPEIRVLPDDPLFIAFTSGTSGVPKGVEHSHRSAILNALRVRDAFAVTPDDGLLALAPLAFVGGLTPVVTALVSGACVCVHVLAAEGTSGLRSFAAAAGATVASVGPGRVRAVAEQARRHGPFADVRLVLVGGDRFDGGQAADLAAAFPAARIVQRYSLSETNWVAGCEIVAADLDGPADLPLGWPVPWLELAIVDGEAVVTGDALALGYWGDPERTVAAFHRSGAVRSFRTGDRLRRDDDGLLWFDGRADRATKINGVRVDLAEVEQALRAIDGVHDACVVTAEIPAIGVRLAAFVTADAQVTSGAAVRRRLAERVPRAQVPTVIELVHAIPVSARGKADQAVLGARAADLMATTSPDAVDPVERAIADAVARVLDRERVGRDDDIFALGADSLDTMELLAALEPIVGQRLETSDLLAHPTPAALAAMATVPTSTARGLVHVHRGDRGAVPVVLCSGGGGGALEVMAAIGRGLGPRDVFVPVPRGFEGRGAPDRTIEAMAARLVADVRAVTGDGDVALAGHSSGGIVAFEAAHQLAAAGVRVPVLVLIDTAVPGDDAARRRRQARAAEVRLRHDGPLGALYAELRSRVRPGRLWRAATAGRLPRSGDAQQYAFSVLRGRAIDHYRPHPYAGAVVILRARGTDPIWATDPEREPARDLSLWRRHLVHEPVVLDLEGGHESVVTGGHRAETTAILARVLASYEPSARDDAERG